MSSTYTSSLAIQLMGTGDQSGTWGATTNNNMTYLEEGISGYLSYAVDSTNAVTLNLTQGGDTSPSARNMIINLTNFSASAGVHDGPRYSIQVVLHLEPNWTDRYRTGHNTRRYCNNP